MDCELVGVKGLWDTSPPFRDVEEKLYMKKGEREVGEKLEKVVHRINSKT